MNTTSGGGSTPEVGTTEVGTTEDITGRFPIPAERRRQDAVPPPASEQAEVLSIDALAPLPEPARRSPTSVPPPVPAAARTSAAPRPPASRRPEPEVDAALIDSLRPFYEQVDPERERAQIEVEDLSLRPDNPYLASSLVPPSGKRSSLGLGLALGAAGAAVAAAAVGAALLLRAPEQAPQAAVARGGDARPVVATPVPATHAVEQPEPASPAASAPAPAQASAPAIGATPQASLARPVVDAPEVTPAAPPAPAVEPTAVTAAAPQAAPAPVAAPAVATATPASSEGAPAATEAAASAVEPATAVAAEGAAPAPAAATETLPTLPSREQVAAGFDALLPELTQCAAGKTGLVVIDATLASTGRVAHALIDGAFVGTAEGSCMARAVRKARFPQFADPTLKVRYPVKL